MKVFLSHSTKDAAFVEKLATAMTANGFEPWRCEVDIEKSANFVAEISKGLKQSDLTLLVWSPDAANSVWTEEEWTAVLKQQVEQSRIRLGLIMLRKHDLPPLLDTRNYIDATRDPDKGIRDSLEWLDLRRKAQRFSGLTAPVFLPEYRPEDFVGRTVYLEKLSNALTWQPRAFLLYGEPGAGKSTLALRFAWDSQKEFDAVIFQTCGQRSVETVTGELSGKLKEQIKKQLDVDVLKLPPDEKLAVVKDWFRARRSLLVLDDVWPNDKGMFDVKQLEPGPGCSVLYTSRRQALPGIASSQSSKVEKFTDAEAEELFHTYLDSVFGNEVVTNQRDALLGFARRVEMLPIAVAVGASLLREKAATKLDKAVLRLRLDALSDGAKDVNALFRTAIESQLVREQELLAACAVCVQGGFWLPLAAQIAELSEDDAEDAADRLANSSLLRVVDRDRQRFQLHALLRDQLRKRLAADGLTAMQERHAAALEQLFKDWETRWGDCRECLEEIVSTASFLCEQAEHEREWQLNQWGYSLGRRIGELNLALRIMQQEESLWAGHEESATKSRRMMRSYGNQALILKSWGQLEKAMGLHKRAEALCLELGDKNGLGTSYGNQALILRAWGRLEDALALYKKQEAICLELGNKKGLSKSYLGQGSVMKQWDRLDEAMRLYKKEEAICSELGDRYGLQRSYGNQAQILKAWGRLEEALALLKKKEVIGLGVCREYGITIFTLLFEVR